MNIKLFYWHNESFEFWTLRLYFSNIKVDLSRVLLYLKSSNKIQMQWWEFFFGSAVTAAAVSWELTRYTCESVTPYRVRVRCEGESSVANLPELLRETCMTETEGDPEVAGKLPRVARVAWSYASSFSVTQIYTGWIRNKFIPLWHDIYLRRIWQNL